MDKAEAMQMLDELLGIVCDDLCCKDGANCPIDSHTTKLMNYIEQEDGRNDFVAQYRD